MLFTHILWTIMSIVFKAPFWGSLGEFIVIIWIPIGRTNAILGSQVNHLLSLLWLSESRLGAHQHFRFTCWVYYGCLNPNGCMVATRETSFRVRDHNLLLASSAIMLVGTVSIPFYNEKITHNSHCISFEHWTLLCIVFNLQHATSTLTSMHYALFSNWADLYRM